MTSLQKIIIICGPTAVGKTSISIELAKKFKGEIISADSQQVWRGFDVGTAKVNLREKSQVPHHLIDIADADEHFDAAKFVALANVAIEDVISRQKLPFIVGGTGMYLKMLVHGFCEAPPQDPEYRKKLEDEIEKLGSTELHERLKKTDPRSAEDLHPNDRTRIVRALEIHYLTGVPASEYREKHNFKERRYDALKIGLNIEREELYRRIDLRVDEMIANGLVDEVRSLLEKYDSSCQPFSAVGYREIVSHLKGEIGLEEARELTKKNSRHFAKRQLTWFRADPEIKWFGPDEVDIISNLIRDFKA